LHEAARICEAVGFYWWQAGALARIGAVSVELGRLDEARESALHALSLSRSMHDRKGVVYELGLLAEIDAKTGQRHRAGVIWGAAEAERERAPAGRWLHGTVEPERVLAHADPQFERGRQTGRELTLDGAVALALEDDAS
jgi:hypothetical protein